jgi:hypothetical protein
MNYDTEHDYRRMLPGPEGSRDWPPTAWFREAVDVLLEYIEAGDRLMAGGTPLNTREYFKLTGLSREIVHVRETRDERNQMRPRDTRDMDDVTDFGC